MPQARVQTGISGLDQVLHGGLVQGRTYLARGGPGTGKSTLGLHFLAAGAANQEKILLITMGEPADQLVLNAHNLGLDLTGVKVLDLSPTSDFFTTGQSYDVFSPSEVEQESTSQKIVDQVNQFQPQRIFLDAITQFRYLSANPFQFRQQVLSFLRFLIEGGATVLLTSESSEEAPDNDLQFISDGVIQLTFSDQGRTLKVAKFRGSDFQDGPHSVRLTHHGIEVFPRLRPDTHKRGFNPETIPSGIPELDEMLHGGLERGTVTILSGPSGAGKTTVGLQFMKEAAGRGERSVIYTFEEEIEIMLRRSESVNIPARKMIERGSLSLIKVEPLQFTPDEFAQLVRQEAEEQQARIIMLDSISGYRLSLRGEDLISHIHALCKYLANVGITVLLINETESMMGEFRGSEVGITYLADNFIYLRYWERQSHQQAELRKGIGVLKKRLSDFEKTLRELEITRYGIKVGKPIPNLQGILSNTPRLIDPQGGYSNQ